MNKLLAEYVWIDGYGNLRSKTRVCNEKDVVIDSSNMKIKCPDWNFDGSSTKQAESNLSEVILKPCKYYKDPFRPINNYGINNNVIVLCETYTDKNTPHKSNTRYNANKIFKNEEQLEPLFGMEQEFFITKNEKILGFNDNQKKQGEYYCGVGCHNSISRTFIEEAFDNCLYAGLNLTGLNAEVAPSQWEFQILSYGINVGDDLYMMRYILNRTAEKYGLGISYYPKPIEGEWNGSGCHVNFSTKPMREETNGYEIILEAIKKLEKTFISYGKLWQR